MSDAQQVLDDGFPGEREALETVARQLIDSRAAISAPSADLPGLGAPPDADEVAAAVGRHHTRVWGVRARLYETALDYPTVADRLGVSDRQVSNLVAAGQLLAMDGPHGRRLPVWQFHPDTPKGRLEGIARVAAVYPGRLLGLSGWMVTAHPALGGRTPADALADGDLDA